ncbi:ATP-binding protein [Streptomyces sp. NRRL WC-3742]|uniref:ATP-binding protein n=1 Tax=Streptomyces sp. NRRL WC-3742 TaxID=1463934 RepID=UPI000A5A5E7C|nr:ATP-binding protein [Streptomyces sp. NRRL WC-3742]
MLADTPNAVGWARRHTTDLLRRWQVPSDTIDTANLIVSELVTNAIRHTHADDEVSPYSPLSPVKAITLALWLERGRLVIFVQDNDRRPPVVKEVGEDAESGRGVFLVDALSEKWGYYYPPGAAGKVVWSELLIAGRDPRFRNDDGRGRSADNQGNAGRSYRDTPLVVARTLVALREL